jgi:hypothetical protein
VQRAVPDAHVAKAYNTVGNTLFVDPATSTAAFPCTDKKTRSAPSTNPGAADRKVLHGVLPGADANLVSVAG